MRPLYIGLDSENELKALRELCTHAIEGKALTARSLDLADQLQEACDNALAGKVAHARLDVTHDDMTVESVIPR